MGENAPGTCVRKATRDAKMNRALSSAAGSSETGTKVRKVEIATPDVAKCTAHSADGGDLRPRNGRGDQRPGTK